MTPTPTPSSFLYHVLSTGDPLVQFLIAIIKALAILAVALLFGTFARSRTVRLLRRGSVSQTQANLFGNLVQLIAVVLGVIAILASFGVDWTGLVALLGASGLAIALSLQDLLRNMIAGIYILMEQPFRIGDRISVKDVTGTVKGIELRTTLIITDDNLEVVVPNGTLLTEIITNRSVSQLARQALLVRVGEMSVTEASKRIGEALKDVIEIAEKPAPIISLEGAYADGVVLQTVVWLPTSDNVALTQRVAEAIQTHLPGSSVTLVKV